MRQFRARLRYGHFRRGHRMLRFDHRRLLRVHRGLRGLRRRHRLIVLLLRNFVLGHQRLVARHILRGFGGIRFGHFHVGLRQTHAGLRHALLLLRIGDRFRRFLP